MTDVVAGGDAIPGMGHPAGFRPIGGANTAPSSILPQNVPAVASHVPPPPLPFGAHVNFTDNVCKFTGLPTEEYSAYCARVDEKKHVHPLAYEQWPDEDTILFTLSLKGTDEYCSGLGVPDPYVDIKAIPRTRFRSLYPTVAKQLPCGTGPKRLFKHGRTSMVGIEVPIDYTFKPRSRVGPSGFGNALTPGNSDQTEEPVGDISDAGDGGCVAPPC